MKDKLIVVTRTIGSPDETNRVEFWPISTDFERKEGKWLPSNRKEKSLEIMETTVFKKIFGFTPRTGTKETLRISMALTERNKNGEKLVPKKKKEYFSLISTNQKVLNKSGLFYYIR